MPLPISHDININDYLSKGIIYESNNSHPYRTVWISLWGHLLKQCYIYEVLLRRFLKNLDKQYTMYLISPCRCCWISRNNTNSATWDCASVMSFENIALISVQYRPVLLLILSLSKMKNVFMSSRIHPELITCFDYPDYDATYDYDYDLNYDSECKF